MPGLNSMNVIKQQFNFEMSQEIYDSKLKNTAKCKLTNKINIWSGMYCG